MNQVAANLARIRERIATAAKRANRAPGAVTLVAVSKKKPAALIREAMAAGQMDFGESYLQEALEKVNEIRPAPRWHFIGHLQSNKARAAAAHFQVIESVDRPKIVHALERHLAELDRAVDIFLQVNISGEAQKSGVAPADLPPLARLVADCPHLRLTGLMGMPPRTPDPEAARPYFRALRHLAADLAAQGLAPEPLELSMGMSRDFEIAIEEGATSVRVGTALFGAR